MEKVHVYQTIFQSTLDTSSRFTVQNSNGSASDKHPPSLLSTRQRLLICVPCVKIKRKL